MNILLVNHYAGSMKYGMEFRPYEFARRWVEMGHNVTIVAADYSHLRKKNPTITRDLEEEKIDGITYCWVKTPRYRSNSLRRLHGMYTFVNKLSRHAKLIAQRYRPDKVISSSTYMLDMKPCKKIAELSGADVYFELHDIWPLTHIEIYGCSPGNPLVRLLANAEQFAYTNTKKVISVLPDACLHIRELGYHQLDYVYIPNGVAPIAATDGPIPENISCLEQRKGEGKFLLLYLGGFARTNALEEFVQASAMCKNLEGGGNIVFAAVGDGMLRQRLELLNKNCGGGVIFTGSVARQSVGAVLQMADCLYIGAKKCTLYRYGVGMNKLFDYMLAERPILSGIEASNDLVREAGCGFSIEPESAGAIARGVIEMARLSPIERERMGKNGGCYVRTHHNLDRLAAKFLDALQSD